MPRAVNDDVIVRLVHEKESYHGIIIPDQAKADEAQYYGVVVSVGPESTYGLQENQKILFTRKEGFEIREGEEVFLRLRREWILAVLL